MPTPLLTTKLYIPPPRPNLVPRPRLIERLNEGLRRKLTLISAPAGFGKTTLLNEWVAGYRGPVAWVSLDEGDNDPPLLISLHCHPESSERRWVGRDGWRPSRPSLTPRAWA